MAGHAHYRNLFGALVFLLAGSLGAGAEPRLRPGLPIVRPFHKVALTDLAQGKVTWTHVETEGYLTYRRLEADGDWHLRLCASGQITAMDSNLCIIAEAIPEMPDMTMRARDAIVHVKYRIRGITRKDPEHGWFEVHPLFLIEAVP